MLLGAVISITGPQPPAHWQHCIVQGTGHMSGMWNRYTYLKQILYFSIFHYLYLYIIVLEIDPKKYDPLLTWDLDPRSEGLSLPLAMLNMAIACFNNCRG